MNDLICGLGEFHLHLGEGRLRACDIFDFKLYLYLDHFI